MATTVCWSVLHIPPWQQSDSNYQWDVGGHHWSDSWYNVHVQRYCSRTQRHWKQRQLSSHHVYVATKRLSCSCHSYGLLYEREKSLQSSRTVAIQLYLFVSKVEHTKRRKKHILNFKRLNKSSNTQCWMVIDVVYAFPIIVILMKIQWSHRNSLAAYPTGEASRLPL